MKIAHVIPYLGRPMGGPVEALAGYTAALAERGCSVSVAAAPRHADGPALAMDPRVKVAAFPRPRGGRFRWCPALGRHLARAPADIIHSHGLWTYASYAAGRAARVRGVPHVLAPCGMLQKGALERSALKKRLCRLMFQDRVLREAACLHAKSESEYIGFREFGLCGPAAIIPNPVRRPADLAGIEPAAFRAKHKLDGHRVVLYVGRIHPVKGMRRLVEAWGAVAGSHADWRLVIAGPDECGMRKEMEEVERGTGSAEGGTRKGEGRTSVLFVGPLQDTEKWEAYRAADLFVMPSDFENFGSAIAEAMTAGLPVVATKGTPWRSLAESGAGWWVEAEAEALARALSEGLSLSEAERRQMGTRAAGLAAAFAPDVVAAELIGVYGWLLGGGVPPGCVRLG